MIDPALIPKLAFQHDRNNDENSDIKKKRRKYPLEPSQITPITEYLLSPHEHGYWALESEWNYYSVYHQYILNELGTLNVLDTVPPEQRSVATYSKLLPGSKKDELTNVTARMSSISRLFLREYRDRTKQEAPFIPSFMNWINTIDLEKLRKNFPEACQLFDLVVFNNDSIPVDVKFIAVPTGIVFFFDTPRTHGRLSVASVNKEAIVRLCDFYRALGVIGDASVKRIFAPEETLFAPYFSMLSGVFPHVITDGKTATTFERALDYYLDDDHVHCVSTLGLIAEDYLTRIYASFLRESCAQGLTLGQLINSFNKKINEILTPQKDALRKLDDLYDEVNSIPSGDDVRNKAMFRSLINLIKEDRAYFSRKLEALSKPSSSASVFPARINDNLNEILRYRNAASHNTKIPLGHFEADRTLYSLVSVVVWWQNQLSMTDWSKTKFEIIASATTEARGQI